MKNFLCELNQFTDLFETRQICILYDFLKGLKIDILDRLHAYVHTHTRADFSSYLSYMLYQLTYDLGQVQTTFRDRFSLLVCVSLSASSNGISAHE